MIGPVRKTIEVPLAPAAAFDLFTARLSDWWPADTHSLSAGLNSALPSAITFERRLGGRILETCSDGVVRPWATVTAWDDGLRFELSWYVGRSEDRATRVEVRFSAVAEGTRVDLVHDGFERLGDQADAIQGSYDTGWDVVLGERYGGYCRKMLRAAS